MMATVPLLTSGSGLRKKPAITFVRLSVQEGLYFYTLKFAFQSFFIQMCSHAYVFWFDSLTSTYDYKIRKRVQRREGKAHTF
jgi:hypothetical protein